MIIKYVIEWNAMGVIIIELDIRSIECGCAVPRRQNASDGREDHAFPFGNGE